MILGKEGGSMLQRRNRKNSGRRGDWFPDVKSENTKDVRNQ